MLTTYLNLKPHQEAVKSTTTNLFPAWLICCWNWLSSSITITFPLAEEAIFLWSQSVLRRSCQFDELYPTISKKSKTKGWRWGRQLLCRVQHRLQLMKQRTKATFPSSFLQMLESQRLPNESAADSHLNLGYYFMLAT